ncbi:metallopeptidase domain-containing protein [Qiania dongpingensis]|uniref:M6 family metalloprotease domain-containing protein n=1 Tax=Qiania dongpingensis TaxID=2763669 RepID=A0A7G9G501_9FIRM|nr:hypothetical protein [Qiania dongpingensis]QNM05883.1 hypothetical protein H9Q78_01530 [Qiania dongpingensis]
MKKKFRGTICAAAVLFLGIILSVLVPVESSGQKNGKDESFANVVVFVRFADSPTENFLEDKDSLTDMYGYGTRTERARKFFQDTTYAASLPSYLEAVSYGQFHVKSFFPQDNGTKIIPYTLSKGFSEYQNNSALGEYEIIAELLESGTLSMDSSVNLDYNGDGCVDNLTVVMDTTGRTISDRDGFAYPHKANFDGSQTLNGSYIGAYNVLNVSTAFDDAGTICHEFLHSIGYPDLYVGDDANTDRPVGGWDIMASSMVPLRFPLAYMRSAVSGWLTVDTLKDSGRVTLAPATSPNGSQAYILKTDQSELEFFVVEYRVKGNPIDASYDLRVPGTGLIVYRINTRVERLSNITGEYGVYVHRYDDGSFSQVQLNNLEHSVFADGSTIGNGDMTKGASEGAIVYSDGSNSGITIDGIVTNEDGTVSFDVHYGDTESLDLWKKDAASIPECSSTMMDMVQASDGTIYMLHKSGNAYQVSFLKNGTWEQIGNVLKDGNEPCITLYEGRPVVSLMDPAYKKQSVFLYQDGNWKEVSLPAADFWNKASIVGTDFGLFSVVTGSDNALSVYRYRADTGILEVYMKNLIPSSEYPVQVHLTPGEGAFYLGYRAFGDGELLKSVKVSKDGTVLKSSSGFACEDLTMARSDNGYLYVLARQKGKAEAALFQYDDSSWKGLDSFPIGKSTADMSLLIRGGVPYAAVRSDGQSGTDGKTAVFYRSSDGVWSQLGYYAGNEAPEFAFLYSDEEYIKLVFSYGSGNGGSLAEHKYHSLAPNGGKVEESTSQPSSSESSADDTKLYCSGIYLMEDDGITITAGAVTESNAEHVMYRWEITDERTKQIVYIQDWIEFPFINWKPENTGSYRLHVEVMADNKNVSSELLYNFSSVRISGICQMPNPYGNGFMIGVETNVNPNSNLRYELMILDCTLLAQGKPAWIWSTGQTSIASGKTLWAIWNPKYGYYWTYFRVYNRDGILLDDKCFGFQNI